MEVKKTTIQIEESIWKWLNSLKRSGETFHDVLIRLKKMVTKYKLRKELEMIE